MRRHVFPLALAIAASTTPGVSGQGCPVSWSGPGAPDLDDIGYSLGVYDPGSGPQLFAGGDFFTAGGINVQHVARYTASGWATLAVGSYLPSYRRVRAMAVYDDGTGPAIYLGGSCTSAPCADGLARWSGGTLQRVGGQVSGDIIAMCVFDDGTGPALYIAGDLRTAGGVPVSQIAKWNGVAWSALPVVPNDTVTALSAFDDGSGPALFVGGAFTSVGSLQVSKIAKWDGLSWSALDVGLDDQTFSFVPFNDGSGPALYAGGLFTHSGSRTVNHVARWNGTAWSSVGPGLSSIVQSLAVYDNGSGPRLTAGGHFPGSVASWDGTAWNVLGSGFGTGWPEAIIAYNDGTGAALYATGQFTNAGGAHAVRVARWNGQQWTGLDKGAGGGVRAIEPQATPASSVIVGGDFTSVGPNPANHIATFLGNSWATMGPGLNSTVRAIAIFDDGAGPAVYAGGDFTSSGATTVNRIARWNGTVWAPVGTGMDGTVSALTVFDDGGGPALYAGGSFASAGGTTAHSLARWNGLNWASVGGASEGTNGAVLALAPVRIGGVTRLYLGGSFTSVGSGVPASRIASWDGSAFATLGSGFDNTVEAIASWNDGTGTALYAGGLFVTSGGLPLITVARWDGAAWSALAAGLAGAGQTFPAEVQSLASFNDGRGPALYAGGAFTNSGAVTLHNIARWDGHAWDTDSATYTASAQVHVLAAQEQGTRPALYAGGDFISMGGISAERIALRARCACYANCDTSTSPPILNVNDFACFINHFAAGDSYANCDQSTNPPVLNVNDFACFINAFAAGCP